MAQEGAEKNVDEEFVRVSFYHAPKQHYVHAPKQHYVPGKFRQKDRHIVHGWVVCAKEKRSPASVQVDQQLGHHNKIVAYSFEEFRTWWDKRFGESLAVASGNITYDPDVWIQGDSGWIAQHGPKVETLKFGNVEVLVSRVKEGHGIFFAGNIPAGSYTYFTVFERTMLDAHVLNSSNSSNSSNNSMHLSNNSSNSDCASEMNPKK